MRLFRRLRGALGRGEDAVSTAGRRMAGGMPQRDSVGRSREAERYRKAATDALTQVDWCIEYLKDNQQGRIAGRLERNRKHISARLGD